MGVDEAQQKSSNHFFTMHVCRDSLQLNDDNTDHVALLTAADYLEMDAICE